MGGHRRNPLLELSYISCHMFRSSGGAYWALRIEPFLTSDMIEEQRGPAIATGGA